MAFLAPSRLSSRPLGAPRGCGSEAGCCRCGRRCCPLWRPLWRFACGGVCLYPRNKNALRTQNKRLYRGRKKSAPPTWAGRLADHQRRRRFGFDFFADLKITINGNKRINNGIIRPPSFRSCIYHHARPPQNKRTTRPRQERQKSPKLKYKSYRTLLPSVANCFRVG